MEIEPEFYKLISRFFWDICDSLEPIEMTNDPDRTYYTHCINNKQWWFDYHKTTHIIDVSDRIVSPLKTCFDLTREEMRLVLAQLFKERFNLNASLINYSIEMYFKNN